MRAAVVGGGVSGIRAALSLARAGGRITLFEKNRHLGGRAFSFATPDFGEIDVGQHIWLRCCVALEALLADLGVPDEWVYRQDRVAMPYRCADGRVFDFAATAGPAALALLPALLRAPGVGAIDKLRYLLTMARVKLASPATLAALDGVPFADWLRRHGQTPAVVRVFWEPLIKGVCNGRLAEVSARHALHLLRLTLLRSPADSAICLLRCPLSAVFDRLARAALTAAGVAVRTGADVAEVLPGRPAGVRGRTATEWFDRVVVAVPPRRLGGLLPGAAFAPPPAEGAIVGLLLRFARPVMSGLFFTAVGVAVQHVFNKTAIWRHSPADGSQILELVLSAAEREAKLGVERVAAELLPELGRLLPAVRSTPLLARRLVVHAAATFRVTPGGEANRPGVIRPGLEGVMIAGDYADTGLPSTLESAVRAGEAAARAALGEVTSCGSGR